VAVWQEDMRWTETRYQADRKPVGRTRSFSPRGGRRGPSPGLSCASSWSPSGSGWVR